MEFKERREARRRVARARSPGRRPTLLTTLKALGYSLQANTKTREGATTRTGLDVHARLDDSAYPKGIHVTDQQLAAVQLTGDAFHPEWNDTINSSLINP